VHAGCRFFAGYPITPATYISSRMCEVLPQVGGLAVIAEDEIAALGMCIAASATGQKPMTTTSGPGFQLMLEGMGLAVIAQTPVVVVLVQRQGPSTGSATAEAQADVMVVRWGVSACLPFPCLCPDSIESCYELTGHAFNIAERYRTPVVVLTSKELAMTRFRCDLSKVEFPAPVARRRYEGPGPFQPYAVSSPTEVPAFRPIGDPEFLVRFTTSSHDAEGKITPDPVKVAAMVEQLARKIPPDAPDLTFHELDDEPQARVLVVSYGMTARAARVAVREARGRGVRVRHLVLRTLWPAPEALLRRAAEGVERVVVPEQNLGQYVVEVERILRRPPVPPVDGIFRMDTRLLTPGQILKGILEPAPARSDR